MKTVSVLMLSVLVALSFLGTINVTVVHAASTLADTINGCTVNWGADFNSFRAGLIFNKVSPSTYDTYIQQYASSQDWISVLVTKVAAEEDGYDSSVLDTATEQAILNMPMLDHLPITRNWGGGNWFFVYERWILDVYRYAQQFGQTAKWDKNAAYQELLATYQVVGPSMGYNPVTKTAYQQYVRYYDESAETLDCFFKLGGNDAGLWDYIQSHFWSGSMYGYTSTSNNYECEVGFFALVIGNYYVASGKSIPYFDRVYLDLYNKMLANGWSTVAWGVPGVLKHASSNSELRLENTLGAVLALQAFCGSSSWQSSWVNLLTGSSGLSSAWQALISSALYSNGQFSLRSGFSLSADATAMGMKTLFLEGIIPSTGSLAIPLNDEGYEFGTETAFPSSLFRFDYANKRIRIPVNPGELKFQFGSGIVSATFPSAGVYEVQFSSDWNSVVGSPTYISALPSLFHYLQSGGNGPPPPTTGTLRVFATYDGNYVTAPVTISGPSSTSGTTTADANNPLKFDLNPGTYTVSGIYGGVSKSSSASVVAGQTVDVSLNFGGTQPPPPDNGTTPWWQAYASWLFPAILIIILVSLAIPTLYFRQKYPAVDRHRRRRKR